MLDFSLIRNEKSLFEEGKSESLLYLKKPLDRGTLSTED